MPTNLVADNTTTSGGPGPFVGRHSEFARMAEALARARAGVPNLVLIEGPPGIGKTALAHQFLVRAGAPCVLFASGDEAESGLAFGVLSQLLAAAGAESAALAAVRGGGHADGGRSADPLTAGAALVDILGELQRAGLVVLLLDDAQWADRSSLQALTFALRRLRVDRVLAIVIVRDALDARLPESLRRVLVGENVVHVRLGGLNVRELRELTGRFLPRRLSTRAATRLRAHTEGNPLHARALLEQVPAALFEDRDVPLPAPRSFAMLVLARLAGCSSEAETLLATASVLGTHVPLNLLAGLTGLEDPLSAMDEAVAAGLLEGQPSDPLVRFPHPLIRAAVYQQMSLSRRAMLHRRAADRATDEATRLQHLASAATGPDFELAREFAGYGRRCAAQGRWDNAADALAAAARLTPHEEDRQQLTLERVECLLIAGDIPDVVETSAQLRTFAATAWRSHVLGHLAKAAGALDEAAALLRDAWARCDAEKDPVLSARICGALATVHASELDGPESVRWANLAVELTPRQVVSDLFRHLSLTGAAMSGKAREALESMADVPDPAIANDDELELLLGRGELRLYTDNIPGALRDLTGVVAAGRGRSTAFRVVAATTLAHAEYRAGLWDDAATHSDLAVSLATDAGLVELDAYCHTFAAFVPAARGEWATAEAHARVGRAAARSGVWSVVSMSALARAYIGRARGQPEEVIAALEPLLGSNRPNALDEPGITWWQDLLVDALVALGDWDRAEAILGPYEVLSAERDHPTAMAVAARARATLHAARADDTAAEESFGAALHHAGRTDAPFDRALLHLAYGRFLRRIGKRARAGQQLHAARDLLAHLDARPDLERCERELTACGLATGVRPRRDTAGLTTQELAVARLVARGLTNGQVARELVISVKTVEYHLGRLYAKLQVTSRAQLAGRLGED